MKIFASLFILACVALFSGCASGPQFSAIKDTIPPVPADAGRIYIYRTAIVGAAVQPDVKVNGQVVGTAKPQGFIYIDRPAGSYKIETSTEVTRTLSLVVEKGQTRYVRLNISLGFMVGHVYPELVDEATGLKDLNECKFVGAAK